VDELGVYMIQQIGYEQPWPTLGSTLDNLYKFDGLPWSILYIPNDPKWKADGNSSLGQGQLISTTNVSSLMTLDAFVCFGMSLSHVGESWSTKYETRPWVDIAMSMSGQYQTAVTSLPDGSIYISSDYGNTWTTVYRDVPRSWIGIAMTATGIRQYACSADGLTLESFDFGQSWYKVKIGGQFIYNQVTYDPLDYELSSVCTSNNGFTIYTAIKNLRGPPGVIPTFVIRNFADIYAIYYVTNPGILYPIEPETEVMNAAVTYAATASGGSFVLLSYIGDNNNDGSGIYRTLNDFYTKPKKTSAPSLIYNCIAMSSSGQYVMATSKEDLMNIHLSDDYAKTWSTFPIANAHKCSISFTGQYQVVIQKPGYVYVSTDFGWTWSPRHTSAVRNWSSVTISATGQYITATESEGHIHVCTNDISNINNLQGVQGVQGAIGMNGSTGSGTVGYQGYQGPHGSQGFQSVRGYQGTDGIHGVLGQMGPSGIHGNMGRQGYMGTNGVQGIEGAIGVQGPQGKHGNQGLPGSFSEVHISNILTWDEHKSFLQTQRMIRPVTILYGKSKPMNLEDNTRYISEKVMFEHPFQVIPNVMMTLEVQNGDDQIVRSHSISEITTSFFNYIVASDDPFENHQLTIHYQAVGILTVS
jgi:hypothetical protein